MKYMAAPDPARRIPMKTKTIIFLNNLWVSVSCLFSQMISVGSEASYKSSFWPRNLACGSSSNATALACPSSVSKVTNKDTGVYISSMNFYS